jgi:hypothetical protein
MADQGTTYTTSTTSIGANAGLAFIVGGLVVTVAVLAYALFGGNRSDDLTITIDGGASAVEQASEAIGKAVGN